jgi:hypothetical protein
MNYLCVNLRRWFNRRHAHKGNRVKCKQNDHPTTKQRKERHHLPSSVDDKSSRSQQLGESDLVFRMQSLLVIRTVKFDERITVYELNDWPADVYLEARRGQWIVMSSQKLIESYFLHSLRFIVYYYKHDVNKQ